MYPTLPRFTIDRDIDKNYRIIDHQKHKMYKIPEDISMEIIETLQVKDVSELMLDYSIIENDGTIRERKLPPEQQREKELSLVDNNVYFRSAEDVADEAKDFHLQKISKEELSLRVGILTLINDRASKGLTDVTIDRRKIFFSRCGYIESEFSDEELEALKRIVKELKFLGYSATIKKPDTLCLTRNYHELYINWKKPKKIKRKGGLLKWLKRE